MEELYNIFLDSAGVNTDSRKISTNQIFFALSGPNFDGSAFIESAFEKGAKFAITSNQAYLNQEKVLIVEDVLQFLQEFATYHRSQLNCKILALTGSNGKTTTKELLSQALECNYKISKTQGNLNNHIGVPLSLLAITSDIEMAIIEMGANKIGDIEELCNIAQPDFGFITNIGIAHIEGFGSADGVFKAKTEMYAYLEDEKKVAFVDFAEPKLLAYLESTGQAYYPYNLERSKVVEGDKSQYSIEIERESQIYNIDAKLFGKHNVQNYICAIDIAHFFGVDYTDSVQAMSEYVSNDMRSQIIQKKSVNVILDAYNANLTSMRASIKNFERSSRFTSLILGDMKELGSNSVKYHQEIIDYLIQFEWQNVILIGSEFDKTTIPKRYKKSLSTKDFLDNQINLHSFDTGQIFIKGSRSMQLEKILDYIE